MEFENTNSRPTAQKGPHLDAQRNLEYARLTFTPYLVKDLRITLSTPKEPIYLSFSWTDSRGNKWGFLLNLHQDYASFVEETGRLLRKFLNQDLIKEK